jgi:hypothetical protein
MPGELGCRRFGVVGEKLRKEPMMNEPNDAGPGSGPISKVHGPVPTPLSAATETTRPEGLAFDVAEGSELPGVPTGDQEPSQDTADLAAEVTESGEVPPGGLAVPGTAP